LFVLFLEVGCPEICSDRCYTYLSNKIKLTHQQLILVAVANLDNNTQLFATYGHQYYNELRNYILSQIKDSYQLLDYISESALDFQGSDLDLV